MQFVRTNHLKEKLMSFGFKFKGGGEIADFS